MTLQETLNISQTLFGLALLQQGVEHWRSPRAEQLLFTLRMICGAILVLAWYPGWALAASLFLGVFGLRRFDGPYNGGSDLMTLLINICLLAAQLAPSEKWRAAALGYLGIQLTICYFQSGWVKITNPDWRSGIALQDVFQYTAYPITESTRRWGDNLKLMRIMSWAVFGFEVLFPIAWLDHGLLVLALVIAGLFHLANACLFGLNRFFWIWLCAYPALLWWQGRFAEFLNY